MIKALRSILGRSSLSRQLHEERSEKETILESLGEGVITFDHTGKVRYANFVASKMLGIPRRRLLRTSLPALIQEESSPLLQKVAELLPASRTARKSVTDSILLEGFPKRYLELIVTPSKGVADGTIVVIQDKSSHHKVLEMGKDFVANASHELRTPITIIRGFAETLQDLPEISHEMLIDITDKIVKSCERMDNLVKNLLTLADIENLPESRFQENDLVALVDQCAGHLQERHPEVQITTQKNRESIVLSCDPDLMELAVKNLLENAVKYSQPPAQITISLEVEGQDVRIIVADQGIGIPAEDIHAIFERFYTVNKARSRRLGGAGLGLSIVKTIIERHEGTIGVTSKIGEGSEFAIVLPKQRVFR